MWYHRRMSTQTLSAPAQAPATLSPRRWSVLRILLGLQIAALASMFLSAHWDAAEHAKGAVDSFWYPPHYGIYFAILAAGLLSGAGLLLLVWGSPVSPFRALKQNLALSMVVIANFLNFSGAPADALWHEIFGIDLTVWSPPHLQLLFGVILAALACVVYFLPEPRPGDDDVEPLSAQGAGRTLAIIAVFVLALLLAAFLFIEYEVGVRSQIVLARPRWAFPLLWSWYVCFTLGLVSAATRRVGMATAMALAYDLARLAVLAFDRSVLDYQGSIGYPLVLAALPWDAVLFGLMRRKQAPSLRSWLLAGTVAAVVVTLTTPLFFAWLGVDAELTVTPWTRFWLPALFAGLTGAAAGWWSGNGLRRLRPSHHQRPGVRPEGGSVFGREAIGPKV